VKLRYASALCALGAIMIFYLFPGCRVSRAAEDKVHIDYVMAEKSIDWLEYINAGASDGQIQEYFMKNVAPTDGCKSIIRHWKRFMTWNNEEFLNFILEGMGRIPTDRPLENDDGSLTALGKRRMLWTAALENPKRLREDLADMKEINLTDSATVLARRFLPDKARLKADFHVVVFGGSSAFSVGDENGFDLLQMPRTSDGSLDLDDALRTFAHEIHHTGFADCNESKGGKQTQLVAILAAEGMPTYFIDQLPQRIEAMGKSEDRVRQDLAREWQEHASRLPELYAQAEADIRYSVENGSGPDDMFERWMGGLKGPAYVLGADMFAVIDIQLGLDSARIVAGDHRRFLDMYNKAARLANEHGGHCYVFDADLAEKVAGL
jgi:hypothetical protein